MSVTNGTIDSKRTKTLVVATGVVALLVAFVGGFGLHRFADDWAFVYRAATAAPTEFIFQPFYQHWSPLWHATEILNFKLAGWMDDWFIRSLIILTRILSFGVVWWMARRLGFSLLATVASVAVLGLHHSQGVAIYSYDCYSQCVADVIGWMGVAAFWRSLDESSPLKSRAYLVSLALLLVAMLFKEQGLAAAGVCVVVAAVHFFEPRQWGTWISNLVRTCWPLVLLVVAFTMARALSGLFLGDGGRFGFSLVSLPVNIAQLSFALLTPIKTIDWFDAFRAEPMAVGWLAMFGVLTLVLAIVLLVGGIHHMRKDSASKKAFWLLIGAIVMSFFPVSVMEKVGELYVHTPLMWFALFVGFAVDGWWHSRLQSSTLGRTVVVGSVAVYLVALGFELRANLAEVRETANRAEALMAKFDAALADVPAGSGVLVYNHDPESLPAEYSLYRAITPYSLNLVVKGRPSLLYLTNSTVDFVVVMPKDRDNPNMADRFEPGTPVYELHIRDGAIDVNPL